ncbi:MAG: hypothetical protein ACOZB0_01375 [Pseudomonadota bacterium]
MRFTPITTTRRATLAEAFPEVFGASALPPETPERDPAFQSGSKWPNRPMLSVEPPRQFEARVGEDRRKQCRRVLRIAVLLDTRAGGDRRREARRQEDLANHVVRII